MSTNLPSTPESTTTVTIATPPPPQSEPFIPITNLQITLGVIISLLVIILLTAGVIFLAVTFPQEIRTVRDIFIIVFAVAACSTVGVLVMLLYAVIRLINMLEFEIKPILEKTNETISMVQGTTTFVADNVVRPSITARSYVAGVRQGLKVLFGNPRRQ